MRELHGHEVNACNEGIVITVDGRMYALTVDGGRSPKLRTELVFHDGPVSSPGDCNGLTVEALLAVIIDRMQEYQRGPFAGRENACALTKLEEAKHWLLARTLERKFRNVEGTHQR